MAAAKKKNKNDASSSLETTSAASAAAAEAKKLAEEVSALEYDDIVDGEATKFKYATVAKEDYGLSTEEILAADDQLLNSFVSLKKVKIYGVQIYGVATVEKPAHARSAVYLNTL
jgi:protein KRI1